MKIKNDIKETNGEILKNKKEVVKEVNDLATSIEQWKKELGRIYKNKVDDIEIIWRPIRRKEYKELLNISVDENEDALFVRQEKTCLMAVLHPNNIEELMEQKAGLASVLSEEILSKSGFELSATEAL